MDNQELHVLAKLGGDKVLVGSTTFFAFAFGSRSKELVQLGNKFTIFLGCCTHASPCIIKRIKNTNRPTTTFDQLKAGSIVVEGNVSGTLN